MDKPILMMYTSRIAPEGSCPQRFDRQPFAEGKVHSVQIRGGAVKEKIAEVPWRMTVGEILDLCGARVEDTKALYMGWPTGCFYPADPGRELELNCETLYVVDRTECAAALLGQLAEHVRNCSCGRCVFGREGTYQLHLFFTDILARKGRSTDLERLDELCRAMVSQSACSAGVAAGSSFLSALSLFREELEAHILKKTCPALVCKAYVNYYIDPALCSGCGECVSVCDEDAIEGKKGLIHILDTDLCEKCGQCLSECPVGAVKAASGSMPKLPSRPIARGLWKG